MRKLAIGVLMLMLTACAALAPPKSFDQQLAYSYGAHTAVLSAAATSVELGELSKAEGKQVLELADQSRRILDAARIASSAGDLRTAQAQLALATDILIRLQAHLRSKP